MIDREQYPEPFRERDALFQFRRFWSVFVDALERYLDRTDEGSTRTKEETRRKK